MNDRQFAWEQIKPYLSEITDAIVYAPISYKDRNGLAITAAVHFMGVACRCLKEGDSQFDESSLLDISKEVANLVIAAMEKDESKLNG